MGYLAEGTGTTDRAFLQKKLIPVKPFINGTWFDSRAESRFVTYDPTTACCLLEMPTGHPSDVDQAVAIARLGFAKGEWRKSAVEERRRILLDWADKIDRNASLLNAYDALEMGKPVGISVYDAKAAAGYLRFNAEAIDKVLGDVLPSDSFSSVFQRRVPRGVVGAIVPWNFPTFNAVLKIAPALAAGNSVVLKPSELASQSALAIAQMAMEAGLPSSALSVVPGTGPVVGRALAEHCDVDMVTFTGSTAVGKLILQYAGASNMKIVSAECGGKSPQIVFDDGHDLDAVASSIAAMIVLNQGQVCSVGSRLLVQKSIAKSLVAKIVSRFKEVIPGDPLLDTTQYGPLVTSGQKAKVAAFVAEARSSGAKLACGEMYDSSETGYYYPPTLLIDVDPQSRVAQSEIFGPVLSTIEFDSLDQAAKLANETQYGLSAYVWTTHLETGFQMSEALRTGVTIINGSAKKTAGPGHGFSSEPVNLSGLGVEGGLAGLESFMRRQTVWFNYG